MGESHAKRALDDAKDKLGAPQQVPHGAPQEEAVLKIPPAAPPLLKMPPIPRRAKTVEPATATDEPLAVVDAAAKHMVEGEGAFVAAEVAAPRPAPYYNSKPDEDF